jgi:Clr5 domain
MLVALSDEDWNGRRATFEWLYCSERRDLKEVMKIMEKDHGFLATSVPTCAQSAPHNPLAQESILILG